MLCVKGIEKVEPAALHLPGIHHSGVQSERQQRPQRKRRVLAVIVLRGGMTHLDGSVGHGIHDLTASDDLACRERLDAEAAIGHFFNVFRHSARRDIERFE